MSASTGRELRLPERRPAPALPGAPVRPELPRASRPERLYRPSERLRLTAEWAPRIASRAEARAKDIVSRRRGPEARAALSFLKDSFRREEAEVRKDRAHAFEAMLLAQRGSEEKRAWWTAVEVDSAMLEGYRLAYEAIDSAGARIR